MRIALLEHSSRGWHNRARRTAQFELTPINERELATSRFDVLVIAWSRRLLDLLGALRSGGLVTPIIVWSPRSPARRERVEAFLAGADQLLVARELDARELFARCCALHRRVSGAASPIVRIGPVEISSATRLVRVAERTIDVTRNEFAILAGLAAVTPNVARNEDLLARLGYAPNAQTFTLKTTVSRLRRKLGTEGDLIEAVAGIGYRFVPPPAMMSAR